MKHGVAADIHNIAIEHIQFSHPAIILLLSKLFNCMVAYGTVPVAFGEVCLFQYQKWDISRLQCRKEISGVSPLAQ